MAQVAIIVNGLPDPRKSELARTLGLVLGCPVLQPKTVEDALHMQTGPVVDRASLRDLAAQTIWRTAGLIEAGVIVDASWTTDDAEVVGAGLELAGTPRTVEVWCGGAAGRGGADGGGASGTGPIGVNPVVRVDGFDGVDMDALVVEISAQFGV